MAAIQTDKRRQELCFTTPGEVPTIPSPPGLQWGDPGFTATDIMPGEFAINLPDRKVFFRSGNTIVQIISNEQLTLALNAVLGSIPSGSDDLTNDSTNVAGATVTEALDVLAASIKLKALAEYWWNFSHTVRFLRNNIRECFRKCLPICANC